MIPSKHINKLVEFERNKIRRAINVSGSSFSFKRKSLNEYGEPTNELSEVANIKGVFHYQTSYITEKSDEGGRTTIKRKPMILCLINEESEKVQNGDIVVINGIENSVVDKTNVNELNYAYDISVEPVLKDV